MQLVHYLFRYLQGTKDLKLVYKPDPTSTELFTTYSDADYGGCKDSGHSTGGYLIKLGSGAISWSSKLQSVVALSTTEAEFIQAGEAGKELVWMRKMLKEFGFALDTPSNHLTWIFAFSGLGIKLLLGLLLPNTSPPTLCLQIYLPRHSLVLRSRPLGL